MDYTALFVALVISSVLLIAFIVIITAVLGKKKSSQNKRSSNTYLPPNSIHVREPVSYSDYVGMLGESKVDDILEQVKEEVGGEIYHNLILQDIYHQYTEIDHIYVSECGIFIIETKSWGGKVYGREENAQWEIVLGKGSRVHQKENPFIQNERHVNFFNRVIHPKCEVTPAVVFIEEKLEYIKCKSVILSSKLKDFLLKHEYQEMDENEYNYVVGRLNWFKNNPPMTHDEYIKWQKSHFKHRD